MVHHDYGGRFAIRDGKWKLVLASGRNKQGLYNLETDLPEKVNLLAQHTEVAEQLEQKLSRLIIDGRSTPGSKQKNDGPEWWPQLYWMEGK